jgi:NADH:ubiquinone oxidoreductase subunit 5 (subunit L)/multisubunit Na+/H+ antiporter MnhA subunit
LVAVLAPFASALFVGLVAVLADDHPREIVATAATAIGLAASTAGSVLVLGSLWGIWGPSGGGDVDLGEWLRLGDYVIPLTFVVDGLSVTISLLAGVLTLFVARFSHTYLHKEPGYVRFFGLLSFFATGTQLIAFAGALELFFAGWEMVGIASALFIGYFHERDEPIRSSIRAFSTYRLADAGLLIATVATFELLGSARFSALSRAGDLPPIEATAVALLFLLSAMGKSAQLPFSGWLPRAMEGPTPSSALFYGAVSIHAGLFLMLRVWPVVEVSITARAVGVAVGLATAVYAASVARVHTDAKGALAHATLAQVGLILAEICLGWRTLALTHLVCHALLRLGQYLKAPNTIHDTHRRGHHDHQPTWVDRVAPRLGRRVYAASLHRLRLDDRIDAVFAPVLAVASVLDAADRRLRDASSLDKAARS